MPFSALFIIRGCCEATVAQLAEQLICNQRVGGSIPFGGSRPATRRGEVPERPKGADCKSAGAAFGGSNPPLSTSKLLKEKFALKRYRIRVKNDGILKDSGHFAFLLFTFDGVERGSSSVVERQPSKLRVAGSNPVSRSKIVKSKE